MKILLVGASGTLGQAIIEQLGSEHQIIRATHSSQGDVQVDLGDRDSIRQLFRQVGELDAIISVAGNGQMLPLAQHDDQAFESVLMNKLMGQVNLLRYGLNNLKPGASVTLTSGTAAHSPMVGTSSISMATAALEGFVRAASLELDEVRLNVVSPWFVKETMEMLGMDPEPGISAADSARTYLSALFGQQHGEVLQTRDFIGGELG